MMKHPAITPGEFARFVERDYPEFGADVHYLTNLYYAVRYGQYRLQQEEIFTVEAMLGAMKKKQRISSS